MKRRVFLQALCGLPFAFLIPSRPKVRTVSAGWVETNHGSGVITWELWRQGRVIGGVDTGYNPNARGKYRAVAINPPMMQIFNTLQSAQLWVERYVAS
jgi:hypothetical protein